MVSLRCKLAVGCILDELGIKYLNIELGEVTLTQTISETQKKNLSEALGKTGLELLDEKNAQLVENIKNVIIELVHYSEEIPKVNISEYLTDKLHINYPKLSSVFSETKGMTIEHYFLINKIEKIKELILYHNYSLSEIAYKLNYSSAGHLSNQFKKFTGLTPSHFKNVKKKRSTLNYD